jgi:hypothetical protein
MEQTIIKVCEFHEGLRGGRYYFVIECEKLIHISHYAVDREEGYGCRWYYVDLNRVKGKSVVEVASSRSGLYDRVWIYPAEDLLVDWSLRRKREEPITFINNYELTHLEAGERQLLDEWSRYYRPMLNYVRREVVGKGGRLGVTPLVKVHIEHDLRYPAPLLIPYSANARLASFTSLTKQIHQMWVILRILREFTSENLNLYFEQSSYYPLAIVRGYALWYEFDLTPHTMFGGILWNKDNLSLNISSPLKRMYEKAESIKKRRGGRLSLRPDIAFTYAKDPEGFLNDLSEGRPAIKLILECKNSDYGFWSGDVEGQIKPYAEIFNPEYIVIASLKPVPQNVKEELSRYGADLIDNVHLGGQGEEELASYIKHILR